MRVGCHTQLPMTNEGLNIMANTTPGLYHIPRAQGDMTRVVWLALFLFVFITVLSIWLATQYAAWAFQYNSMLGKPIGLLNGTPIYAPWDILIWTFKYNSLAYGVAVLAVFKTAHLIMGFGGLMALLLPVTLIFRRTRKAADERNDLHGSAHFADPDEVKAADILPTENNVGGVMFGAYHDGKQTHYLRHKGPEHMMVFAPTRSGKGVGIVIPTLLSWDESVLVHDIKGENWALTSGFREMTLGQRCLRFSPSEPGSARFNPLAEIRLDGNLVKDVQNIATMIVDPDGKGLSDHWAKTGFDLLTGVVLFVLLSKDLRKDDRALCTVQAILSDGGPIRQLAEAAAEETAGTEHDKKAKAAQGIHAVMEYLRNKAFETIESGCCDVHESVGWQTVAQSAQAFLNKAPNEASGVVSTSLSFLALYRDPIVAENTRHSDFTLEDLVNQDKPVSLYLVVPPSDKDRLKPLLRLVINQVVRRLTEKMAFDVGGTSKSQYQHRLLLLIDEFPSLGKLDVFQEALAFIAGYGLKALLVVQDLSQLYAAYGKDESIMSNCHVRIAFAPNKIETAELLSKMIGQSTVSHATRNYSGGRLAVVLQNVSTSVQIVGRSLLDAGELMRLPPDDQIVFVAGHAPVYCQKIKYYEDPAFVERQRMGWAENCGNDRYELVINDGIPDYLIKNRMNGISGDVD